MNETATNLLNTEENALNLRDIHLPEPISWWPIAPGWWLILFLLVALFAGLFIARNIYRNKQINRDIKKEITQIKQQFQQTKSKPQLAKALSILLRRANISLYPNTDIAGLTGDNWLNHLDNTCSNSSNKKFNSQLGKTLITAPYLPEGAEINFDAPSLIELCESWLMANHITNRQSNRFKNISLGKSHG